jgi:periplasmic divalent cation tolerance protein
MDEGSGNVVVLTTTDSDEAARALARKIVGERLAACVQTTPIRSVYRWQGAVHEEGEVLLLIKTRHDLLGALERFIKEHHTYETPEIVALPIVGGSRAYQDWIAAETI